MMINSVLLPNESNQPLVDNLFTKKNYLIPHLFLTLSSKLFTDFVLRFLRSSSFFRIEGGVMVLHT